jgi:hypothetical protein
MQTKKNHLAAVLTLIVIGLSALLFLAFALIMIMVSLLGLFNGEGGAAEMIGAFSFGFFALLLGVCAWFVLDKTRGRESADQSFLFPYASWHILVVIGLGFFGVLIGGTVSILEISWLSWLVLPLMSILVIVPPLWFFFGIGAGGIEVGPRWRFFAVFGLSLTVGPLVMIVLELVILLAIVVGGSAYLAIAQPGLFAEMAGLAQIIMEETNEQVIFNLLTPYIANTAVLAIGIGYIAVIVPLVEELFKPLAVWLFARKIDSPAQGFVLGMVSGAAFGLFESLNASADASSSWAVIVSVRAGTSLLHMATSALVGWGIASAFKEKRVGRLFASFFAAVLIHGVWNAAAAGAGVSAMGESLGKPEWAYMYAPAMVCGLMVMGIGMFAVLVASNRKIKNTPASQPQEERVELSA